MSGWRFRTPTGHAPDKHRTNVSSRERSGIWNPEFLSAAAVRAAIFLFREGSGLTEKGDPGEPDGPGNDEKYDATLKVHTVYPKPRALPPWYVINDAKYASPVI